MRPGASQRTSAACGNRLDRDACGERRAQRETRTAYIQQHRMPSVDHADICSFAQAERAKTACFIGRATDVDNCGSASRTTRRQGAGALRGWLSLQIEGAKLGGHGVR